MSRPPTTVSHMRRAAPATSICRGATLGSRKSWTTRPAVSQACFSRNARIGLRSAGSWATRSSARRGPRTSASRPSLAARSTASRSVAPRAAWSAWTLVGPKPRACSSGARPGGLVSTSRACVRMPPVLRNSAMSASSDGRFRRSGAGGQWWRAAPGIRTRRPRHARRGDRRADDGPVRRLPRGSGRSPRTSAPRPDCWRARRAAVDSLDRAEHHSKVGQGGDGVRARVG